MSRRQIVAGNWKMNKLYEEGITLAGDISSAIKSGVETISGKKPLVILAPPYYLLRDIVQITKDVKDVSVAAQNVASESSGAFTGEVSAAMIASAGATHVIIGHSERRTLFGETDTMLMKKVDQAMANGLAPIFCVGEMLEQRLENMHFEVVLEQLQKGIFHINKDLAEKLIVAYEPVWAIGTGHNATPEQAGEMHAFIRKSIAERYGNTLADNIPLLYGGSCKPDNAASLFSLPDVDGGLIGGASLNAADFVAIIESI